MTPMVVAKLQASWLESPFVRKVVTALGADNIRFVGGAVRDTLIGKTVGDIDAATRLTPEETMAALKAAGIRVVPTGLAHGTVTAVEDGQHVEITTLRVDVKTDGRHAEVAFTTDWREDAARRDFTMNALYAALDGSVYDPFDGLADLKAGHVRFIGDAAARIREDGLRILRFFRFYAWYGKGPVDPAGLAACTSLADMIDTLSAERVRDEMLKTLSAPDPVAAWSALVDAGVAAHLPGKGGDVSGLMRLVARERLLGCEPEAFVRLAVVTGLKADDVAPLAKALRLSAKQKRHLKAVTTGCAAGRVMDEVALRAFVYRHGRAAGLAHLLTVMGDPDPALIYWVRDWPVPVLPVKGGDLIALGVPMGPDVSERLAEIEAEWVRNDFRVERSTLLARFY
ncbi:CCA tRNA nucleotidyltransferase [Kordiimonas marina]|uniref:CCA tRNA nucleotidyltransferase n=1 Tax=Kordiimonas marina TaxID=2872312 RepID=UPI001FF5EF52|nr:CCA tRNA nucleotidyltransferase [Kordiimonas marina]MCJ9427526.1 CCA tRNA nucleotidyltransferase [Kordiimonas marina]